MQRKRLVAIGFVAVLPLAVGAWWAVRRSEPSRPPELFGKVEAVRNSERGGTSFLIRSTQPNRPGWESEQNAWHRQYGRLCWVTARDSAPIRQREGGRGEVAVGQMVSAWCSGPMAASQPPIWGGDFVVVEPDDR